MKKLFSIVFVLFLGTSLFAQTTVTGLVKDAKSREALPGVSIKVVGKSLGTVTDFDGKFTLKVSQNVPFKLEVSYVGFTTKTIDVSKNNMNLNIVLDESNNRLDEVVVSASRTPESIRESPVTIEHLGIRDIQNSTAASFYQGLQNLKGVDVNTGSLTFNAVNTRGFATFANTRFVQLVDGMDNASPALNFVMGNLVGVNELDLKSVELLPGASSALYGANAFNGILFMTTKNPFDYQGISSYVKTGYTYQKLSGSNQYWDLGIRAAKAFSDKFAAKASFSYMKGTDWTAEDNNQYTLNGIGNPDTITPFSPTQTVHDGLNVYGDEVTLSAGGLNLKQVAQSLILQGLVPVMIGPFQTADLVPAIDVGRTGYREQDLTDYEARSVKLDVSLNYRPFANDLEVIWNTRIGFGNTIYQGADRYSLNNFIMQQHKLEIKNKNFFLRGYTTSENAGDSYDMRFTGINMNKVGATQWFGTYAGAYIQGAGQVLLGGGNPLDPATQTQLNMGARQYADNLLTPQPGTPAFIALFNKVTSDPSIATGSKFLDHTKMYVGEGNYNFTSLLKEGATLQIGGSYRRYALNSGGTIFTDGSGPIDYNEYGAYIQGSKKLADERLKLQASLRYDKNVFFKGNYSPRASIVYSAGDHKQHNFRASYQTGFRNPDTQALFIGFDVGRAILVGSSPANLDRPLPNTTLTGRKIYNDSYTLNSVGAFGAAVQADLIANIPGGAPAAMVKNIGLLKSVKTPLVQPEKVTAYDLGYRGMLGKVSVDFDTYYNKYKGFISNKTVITPISGSTADLTTFSGAADILTRNFRAIQTYTNSTADVSSYGATIGLNTTLSGFDLGLSYTYARFNFNQASDPDFQAGFNTPQNKVKMSFGKRELFKNFGFNINARWNDKYFWQSSSANAIVNSRTIVDAQVNYKITKMKSVLKFGGSNIFNQEYFSAPGTGAVGSLVYVSLTINP